ncbi:FtsB family cell division protein [Thermovibrio ammonificans]|uniref:Septum formation initiator n=1 Tax=Thermovibrio ammonificans (strain DSM 15698 / JCM 12110 / HB-1) TaxID=648996 RepID=E8T5Q0_THEA1|nr:hypothetical protein [Thermovibrio ammonificans]ADU96525.1 hypothetical protein Theam_0553 [Thermovibrio ammonificans HB-1]
MSRSRSLRCSFTLLVVFWALFGPWAFYSYFYGENSVSTLKGLKETYSRLKKERDYWADRNELLRERLQSFKENKDFYYKKLAREMFVKGKDNEDVILFVK